MSVSLYLERTKPQSSKSSQIPRFHQIPERIPDCLDCSKSSGSFVISSVRGSFERFFVVVKGMIEREKNGG
jgi:hypothetical protein